MTKPNSSNDPARRLFGLPRVEGDARRRGLSAIALTGAAPLVCAALALFAPGAFADKPDTDSPEFIEFLEYLGSWEGPEEDWVQFLSADDEAISVDDLPQALEPQAESAGL